MCYHVIKSFKWICFIFSLEYLLKYYLLFSLTDKTSYSHINMLLFYSSIWNLNVILLIRELVSNNLTFYVEYI